MKHKNSVIFLIIFSIMTLIDGTMTYLAIGEGYSELNPIVNFFIVKIGLWNILLLKILQIVFFYFFISYGETFINLKRLNVMYIVLIVLQYLCVLWNVGVVIL